MSSTSCHRTLGIRPKYCSIGNGLAAAFGGFDRQRHLPRRYRRPHVMPPHDRDARGDRDRIQRRHCGFKRARTTPGRETHESLARSAYQYWITQRTESRQGAEEREAITRLLGEPEAGVEDDARAGDAGPRRSVRQRRQATLDLADHVAIVRELHV